MTTTEAEKMFNLYVDLPYLHMWDSHTPVDEVLRAFDDLVRAGKALYIGLSDIPAWQAARMQAIADVRGWSPVVALQIQYLTERTVERDLIPMARELGMGVLPWSPLAGGVLSGKYAQTDLRPAGLDISFESRKMSRIQLGFPHDLLAFAAAGPMFGSAKVRPRARRG